MFIYQEQPALPETASLPRLKSPHRSLLSSLLDQCISLDDRYEKYGVPAVELVGSDKTLLEPRSGLGTCVTLLTLLFSQPSCTTVSVSQLPVEGSSFFQRFLIGLSDIHPAARVVMSSAIFLVSVSMSATMTRQHGIQHPQNTENLIRPSSNTNGNEK